MDPRVGDSTTYSETSSSDHLSLGPADRDIIPDGEQADVGLGVLGKVLLLGESKMEDIPGVFENRKQQAETRERSARSACLYFVLDQLCNGRRRETMCTYTG
jgi:hypothetical protein